MKKYVVGNTVVYAHSLNEALILAEEVRKLQDEYYGEYYY